MNGTALSLSLSLASVYASATSAQQSYMYQRAVRDAEAFRPAFVNMAFVYVARNVTVACV